MATLVQAAMFATAPDMLGPITLAAVKAAVAVANEAPETDRHQQRVNHANRVLADPTAQARIMAWGVASNATVVDKWVAGDTAGAVGDLEFVVNSLWGAYSY